MMEKIYVIYNEDKNSSFSNRLITSNESELIKGANHFPNYSYEIWVNGHLVGRGRCSELKTVEILHERVQTDLEFSADFDDLNMKNIINILGGNYEDILEGRHNTKLCESEFTTITSKTKSGGASIK